jgi:predicted Fe-Mo cluster-binding NifX family protein
MKVAVTAAGPGPEAAMDPRFGRCSFFVLIETDDMSFEAVENASSTLGGGAGIQAAKLVAQKGAKVVLTGDCGPRRSAPPALT